MKYLLLISFLFITACGSNPTIEGQAKADTIVDDAENDVEESDEPPRDRKVYYFQHRLIPDWLYNTEGKFFEDLKDNYSQPLFNAAQDIIDVEFGSNLKIEYIPEKDAVLFIFEKPKAPANCFYAIAQRVNDGYLYTTYENTFPFGDDVYGVVGGWSKEGSHLNMGPRTYKSESEFVQDILGGRN